MAKVSIGPTQSHHIASIRGIQESTVLESTGVRINTIMDTHRRRLELSVGVLVVRDFVDGGDSVDGEFTVKAAIFPRLQRLPNLIIYAGSSRTWPLAPSPVGPISGLSCTSGCPGLMYNRHSGGVAHSTTGGGRSSGKAHLVEGAGRARKLKSAVCPWGFISFPENVLGSRPPLGPGCSHILK